jgi:flagellar biogenesis protein FliO
MRPLRLALVLLALAAPAMAEVAPDADAGRDSARSTEPVGAFPTPLAGSFARVLAALALITGTGAGLAWWSRKRRGLIGTTAGRIQVLASRAIGPRHQLVLIEVGERRLLLGTAPESVRALADLSEVPPFAAQLGRELPEIERDLRDLGSFGDLHV